uniref:Beta-1,4-N-acetylgalactosaminyltransferase n=1 Tax=Naja naja TaxID=35670 RepID=A0A8C6VIG1_NAJNA
MLWFPVKKIRKQFKLLLLLVLLTFAVWFTYLHINLVRQGKALRLHFAYGRGKQSGRSPSSPPSTYPTFDAEDSSESREDEQMVTSFVPGFVLSDAILIFQYKGRSNLHVFEDWCGGAVGHLRKNLHFPLYPHTRTTVKKLAVSPKWKNYGLRIFGYIHPFKDGDFQFSVASDDNSEFWLSSDETPANIRLVAFVGKLGSEWTAPGEFTKFSSQVSKPIRVLSSRRYYFELLHKQDDRGSDHVEVGWRIFLPSFKFEVIDSPYISLYTDESSLKMNEVGHVPQSLASHADSYLWGAQRDEHGADMLKPDPRDIFFLTPKIEPSHVENVLVPCAYSPTYVVKDFPIARYQGLQFVYLSFVYPNDFTRLTHMESENKCFYRESPMYLEKFGFSKYMKMDEEEEDLHQRAFLFLNPDNFLDEEEEGADSPEPTDPFPDVKSPSELDAHEGDQGLLSSSKKGSSFSLQPHLSVPFFAGKTKQQSPKEEKQSKKETNKPPEKVYVTRLQPSKKKAPSQKDVFPGVFLYPRSPRKVRWNSRIPQGLQVSRKWEQFYGSKENFEVTTPARTMLDFNSSEVVLSEGVQVTSFLQMSEMTESQQKALGGPEKTQEEEVEEEVSDYSYENSEIQQSWLEDSINWQRTFNWNDLRCNVSGNLQLSESEVVDVVAQYMEKLNEKNGGIYTLLRIINVEKRRDTARGNRYLMELELMERGQRTVRLSEYIYVLLHQGKSEDSTEVNPEGPATVSTQSQPPPSAWSLLYGKPTLCRPLRLSWRHDVMIHFVVPVKNQARWVQQFISDMASLFLNTKDANFNIILVDFDSDDMHVEKALQEAHLPRYQYLKRTGNFERSAGLQAGVDAIEDGSSIVFLCDLHIHFPLNILDSIRKHCVEGKLAYAPIVMRLGCGSSPREPNGYWEVNGFGLFGIYKSDFDRIGGMNTEEFRDRWGGEDWELLDRVLQSGLEVERLRLRNFYHYYHSKRGMWNSHNKKTPKD